MPKKKRKPYRPVPPMNPVIQKDAYDFLFNHYEEVLEAVEESIEQGYRPEEIYQHWLREAGFHRIELAKRCENAARYLLRTSSN